MGAEFYVESRSRPLTWKDVDDIARGMKLYEDGKDLMASFTVEQISTPRQIIIGEGHLFDYSPPQTSPG